MRAMLIAFPLVAALVSIPTSRADEPLNRADLVKSSNNLKQIAPAFHNHHDTYMKCPGDILDKDGKPLLSGRVAILPFSGISHVAMCDGSVRRLGANADEDELKKLIMPADGGAIDFKKLEK